MRITKKIITVMLCFSSLTSCSTYNGARDEKNVHWETADGLLAFDIVESSSGSGYITINGERVECVYTFSFKNDIRVSFNDDQFNEFGFSLDTYKNDLVLHGYRNGGIYDVKDSNFVFYGKRTTDCLEEIGND